MTEMKLKMRRYQRIRIVFTHVTIAQWVRCGHAKNGWKKAIGSDGIIKQAMEKIWKIIFQDLMERMKRAAYIPEPVRQVLIRKKENDDIQEYRI